MKSETHRANILNTHYQEIGVATVEGKIDGVESIITVELFGTPFQVIADQSHAVTPKAVEPVTVEVDAPEVKSAEITDLPLMMPIPDQVTPSVSLTPESSLSWVKTQVTTIKTFLMVKNRLFREQLFGADRFETVEILTVAFLMFASFIGLLVVLFRLIDFLISAVRKKGLEKVLLTDTLVLSQTALSALHQSMKQSMKQNTNLMHDIRPG
jgi:hypothetical protein